jgi:hypothetical protein
MELTEDNIETVLDEIRPYLVGVSPPLGAFPLSEAPICMRMHGGGCLLPCWKWPTC